MLIPRPQVLLKKIKFTAFNESVELHLNVDKTGLKGEISLPHSTGKTFRVKIVDDKVIEEIGNGKLEFDIKIIPYRGDDSWVEGTIKDLHKCLNSDKIPESGMDCDYCKYREAVKEIEKS